MRKELKKKKGSEQIHSSSAKGVSQGVSHLPTLGGSAQRWPLPFSDAGGTWLCLPAEASEPSEPARWTAGSPLLTGQPPATTAAGHTVLLCCGLLQAACPLRGHRRSSPGSPGSPRWPGIQLSPSRHTEPSPSHTTGHKGRAGSPAGRSGPRSAQKCPPLQAAASSVPPGRLPGSALHLVPPRASVGLWPLGLCQLHGHTGCLCNLPGWRGAREARHGEEAAVKVTIHPAHLREEAWAGQQRQQRKGTVLAWGCRRRQEAVVLSCLAVWEGAPWRPG